MHATPPAPAPPAVESAGGEAGAAAAYPERRPVPVTSSAAPTASAPAAPIDPNPHATFASKIAEPVLMARLREVAGSDPALAIQLARAGNRRFPDSPDAPERYSILIHALGAQGQSGSARGEAEYMVNHFQDSTWVREIESLSGAHRHRNIRVTDAGIIQTE
jgi:hypothetical protein